MTLAAVCHRVSSGPDRGIIAVERTGAEQLVPSTGRTVLFTTIW